MVRVIAIVSFLLAFLCALNLWFVFSNNLHIYKTLKLTVLKGYLGPQLFDYTNFYSDTLHTKTTNNNSFFYAAKPLTPTQKLIEAHTKYKTTAFLVIKNDSVVHEYYANGITDETISNSFSMAKSVVSALIGVALQQNKITHVNQPISNFLPQYNNTPEGKITLKNLLQMSAGMNFDEDYLNPFAFPGKAYYGNNLKELLNTYKLVEEPGVFFNYQGGSTQLLAFVVEAVFKEPLAQVFKREIWQPIGAETTGLWLLDNKAGTAKASCCLIATAKDFAKFGKLYLDSGLVNQKPIIPKWFVKESLSPCNLIDVVTNEKTNWYGYQWWLGNHKNTSFFYARGILGQYIICIPQKNMIIVRLGHLRSKQTENHHPLDLYDWLNFGLSI